MVKCDINYIFPDAEQRESKQLCMDYQNKLLQETGIVYVVSDGQIIPVTNDNCWSS
jgi:hypothetical protein